MKTVKDYTVNFRGYGKITVPAGTRITHNTACGYDEEYNFVDDLSWIDVNYPHIKFGLKHDCTYYGINVPSEYVK